MTWDFSKTVLDVLEANSETPKATSGEPFVASEDPEAASEHPFVVPGVPKVIVEIPKVVGEFRQFTFRSTTVTQASLVSQGLNRIEVGGFIGRVGPEDDSDDGAGYLNYRGLESSRNAAAVGSSISMPLIA